MQNKTTVIYHLINVGENVEKRKPPTLLVGMQTGRATVENIMEVS